MSKFYRFTQTDGSTGATRRSHTAIPVIVEAVSAEAVAILWPGGYRATVSGTPMDVAVACSPEYVHAAEFVTFTGLAGGMPVVIHAAQVTGIESRVEMGATRVQVYAGSILVRESIDDVLAALNGAKS